MQCKNCQHFGHSARNCSRRFRCVKCCDSHNPVECPTDHLPRTDSNRRTTSCLNCGQDHPANYRGCQAHIALIKANRHACKKLENDNICSNSPQTHTDHRMSTLNKHFAPQNRNNQHRFYNPILTIPMRKTASAPTRVQRNFQNRFIRITTAIRNFAPSYRNLRGEAKQQALIVFILSITPM